jgi:hypothetical protein
VFSSNGDSTVSARGVLASAKGTAEAGGRIRALFSGQNPRLLVQALIRQTDPSRDILTPPTTTGIALETTRTVSIGEQRQSVDVEAATQGIQLVRTYLASIKEDFVVMWDDCWYALQSGNPDSLSGPSGKFTRQWV